MNNVALQSSLINCWSDGKSRSHLWNFDSWRQSFMVSIVFTNNQYSIGRQTAFSYNWSMNV